MPSCGSVQNYVQQQQQYTPRKVNAFKGNRSRPRTLLRKAYNSKYRQAADLNDCGACQAVGEDARRECQSHCAQYEDGSFEQEACYTDCDVAARDHYHNTCVALGRCPEVLCPRPAPAPTPCEACKLDCAAEAAAAEAIECQNKEGAEYTRCKNAWQLRKYDCIENNCFASKVCCDWQATQPIEDDGLPSEPIPHEPDDSYPEPYDPEEPVGTYPDYEPEEPVGTYPVDPDEEGPIDEIEALARAKARRSALLRQRVRAPRYSQAKAFYNQRARTQRW